MIAAQAASGVSTAAELSLLRSGTARSAPDIGSFSDDLAVGAGSNHAARTQAINDITSLNRRQTMSDHNKRFEAVKLGDHIDDLPFRFVVECRGCFIHDEHITVIE